MRFVMLAGVRSCAIRVRRENRSPLSFRLRVRACEESQKKRATWWKYPLPWQSHSSCFYKKVNGDLEMIQG
jgi:hypothetical protein